MALVLTKVTNGANAVRNNWKKSVAAVVASGLLVRYLRKREDLEAIRREYASEALRLGRTPINESASPRRITVLVNRVACWGKAYGQFQQDVLPLLNLGGVYVDVVQTTSLDQMRDILGVIDAKDADSVVLVGGDGTVSEGVTALMRNRGKKVGGDILGVIDAKDADSVVLVGGDGTVSEGVTALMRNRGKKLPTIGFFPTGVSCLSVRRLLGCEAVLSEREQLRQRCDLALAVLENAVKDVGIAEVTTRTTRSEEVQDTDVPAPPVTSTTTNTTFSLSALRSGPFVHADDRQHKYWYFTAYLKRYVAYLRTALFGGVSAVDCTIEYRPPCPGCSHCQKSSAAASFQPRSTSFFGRLLGFGGSSATALKSDGTIKNTMNNSMTSSTSCSNIETHSLNIPTISDFVILQSSSALDVRLQSCEKDGGLPFMKTGFSRCSSGNEFLDTTEDDTTNICASYVNVSLKKSKEEQLPEDSFWSKLWIDGNVNDDTCQFSVQYKPRALRVHLPLRSN